MENLRNRTNAKLVSKKKDYLKLASKPNYLVVICKNKVTLTFSKTEHVGMCILDLSKVLMNKFHYDYIKNKYGNNSRLFFTNNGSLKN